MRCALRDTISSFTAPGVAEAPPTRDGNQKQLWVKHQRLANKRDEMSRLRAFSAGNNPQFRTLEDAPRSMRQELVDALYYVAGNTLSPMSRRMNVDNDLYLIVSAVLGIAAAGNPTSGRKQRMMRDLNNCEDWRRIYDLVVRLWPEFARFGLESSYRESINRIFAAYGVAWDLDTDGLLVRVLPAPVTAQVDAVFQELSNPIFTSARDLTNAAAEAFNDRPRRGREACANMFDAMEATAKIRFEMPCATFGRVVAHIAERQLLQAETIEVLKGLNNLRNRIFGHGMNQPFALSDSEVDFTYINCLSGILLLARMP